MRQKIVLLRLVEVVDLVDEEHRALAETVQALGLVDDLLEVFHAGGHSGEAHAARAAGTGENLRQCRLAAARRSPENQRAQLAGADHAAEKFSWAKQMLLADEFIQRFGAHALGQGNGLVGLPGARRIEELHTLIMLA